MRNLWMSLKLRRTNFEMTDLDSLTYFLDMEVKKGHDGVFICQKKFAKEILKIFLWRLQSHRYTNESKEKFSKEDGTEKVDEELYRSMMSCLMYLTTTKPDIMFAVSLLSRFMNYASEVHFVAAKRILRYIKGTTD